MTPRPADPERTHEVHLETPPSPQPKRGGWYLLTGLVLGLILGLVYAWVINPVVYTTSTPANLQADYQDTYRSTIAQTYAVTGNLERAQLRLVLLEDENPVHTLGAQAQRCLAEGKNAEAQALALLASALQTGAPTPTSDAIPTQTLPLNPPTP